MLLLWQNDPCVVIGRHQNPWTESNVPFLRDNKINLARRNSGGGTVFHDLGNLNCTFFTRRSKYDRKRNLGIICNAIRNATALNVAVNSREDIVLDEQHKISGTAAKLGKDVAYHHCTVLVDVNECALHEALSSKAEGIESRATQSVRVPIKNLATVSPNLNVNLLQEAVGWQFLRTNIDGQDEGFEAACQQQRGFQMIRPDNDWFPGLDEIREDLLSYQWIFGKTPKFKVSKSFNVPSAISTAGLHQQPQQIMFELEVNNGIVQEVRVQMPQDFIDRELLDLADVLIKLEFNDKLVKNFNDVLSKESAHINEAKQNFLVTSLHDMIGKFV